MPFAVAICLICFIASVGLYLLVLRARIGALYVSDMRVWFAIFFLAYGAIGPAFGEKRMDVSDIDRCMALVAFTLAGLGLTVSALFSQSSSMGELMAPRTFEGSHRSYMLKASLVGFVLAFALTYLEFKRVGGFSILFSLSRGARIDKLYAESSFTIPYYAVFSATLALMLGLLIHVKDKFAGRDFWYKTITVGCTLLMGGFTVLLAKRSQLMFVIVLVVIVWGMRTQLVVNTKTVMLLVALALTFHVFGVTRAAMLAIVSNSHADVNDEKFFEPPGEFVAPTTSLFYYLQNDDLQFRRGETYVNGLLAPIPRMLYPGGTKPQDIHREYSEEVHELTEVETERVVGLAMVPVAEAYLNFGWYGPFLVYCAYGLIMNFMIALSARSNGFMYLLYPLLLTGTIHIANRTPLCSWTISIVHKSAAFALLFGLGIFLYLIAGAGRNVRHLSTSATG